MKAIVIGATGSTGKHLVDTLLDDKDYETVVILVRKTTAINHPKLIEVITDFSDLGALRDSIKGDVAFSCLGTTLADAGSKEKQWKIDFDIPAAFAQIAKENGVNSFVLVSSYGASSKSSVFYSKMKGELEEKIESFLFNQYIIFQPGSLIREGSTRMGEKISVNLITFLNKIGILKKFRPLSTSLLAQKLAKSPKILPQGKTIIKLEHIFEF
ncbi:NAD(P)H-binding protein [Flavobacterium hungaricum]|uniref:NAD-dependent epimerase/dehydratase family protein n=1 Tax=Flavobacterium hungaricum TaxID=2082725 RepID=A0ABR9TSK1_9FLAO|nr:NAD(P)H-binding protein [Flavobacterium hungaricum]MBE8728256.1 NAD-dependent epimerase/dehydratase family protein [Flavobacterium hungaricum]